MPRPMIPKKIKKKRRNKITGTKFFKEDNKEFIRRFKVGIALILLKGLKILKVRKSFNFGASGMNSSHLYQGINLTRSAYPTIIENRSSQFQPSFK